MFSTPYIAGKAIDVPPSALLDVVNPADQKPFARIFMAQEQHMRAAIDAHARLLLAWNRAVNLTAIRTPQAVALEHVADSLAAVPLLLDHFATRRSRRRGLDMLDLGSGGGYPGLPVAIAVPAARAVLLDSIAKKTAFLATAAVAAVEALRSRGEEPPAMAARTGRAEELACGPDRDRWDLVTARAVAPLSRLIELGLPLVRSGGFLVAWQRDRGDGILASAIATAEPVLVALGGAPRVEVIDPSIPGLDDHRLVVARKRRATPAAYPRRVPGKRPLIP